MPETEAQWNTKESLKTTSRKHQWRKQLAKRSAYNVRALSLGSILQLHQVSHSTDNSKYGFKVRLSKLFSFEF